jgi:hypothetical protein
LTNHLLAKDFIPALQNNGGQALHLLKIALKTDSDRPLHWGILSSYHINRILTDRNVERNYKEKFGEYARRKGYITSFEVMSPLGKQRMLQCPIGKYFIEQGILFARDLDKIAEKQRIFNRGALEMA